MMDCNANNSMDEPGPSKTPNKNQGKDDEMAVAPSTSRKRRGMQIDHSDDSDDDGGQSTSHEKRSRLVNIDYAIHDSSSSDSDAMYVVPRYVSPNSPNYPNINVPDDAPLPFNNDVKFIQGYWLLITNIMGGWNKSQVRSYFRSHFGLECQKSKPFPGVHLTVDDFRMMFSFSCKEGREFVMLYLTMKDLQNCFNFIAVDQVLEGSLESDSDDDKVTPNYSF